MIHHRANHYILFCKPQANQVQTINIESKRERLCAANFEATCGLFLLSLIKHQS